ncbi:MAG: NADH:flavin oxidoreductase, partial [Planctomycetaceae bacterium]|nr:NADH:flavin oxidoreductase [Planctomycetaceae bacterium]
MQYPRISTFKTAEEFQNRLNELQLDLPFVTQLDSTGNGPATRPIQSRAGNIGNRYCILPMEGWDGTTDGRPTDLTRRRWKNFGLSGAKLIWGGEAVAVRQDGRANPNQLLLNTSTLADIAGLRELLVSTHRESFGNDKDLLIGLQLTHSGRYAKPDSKTQLKPRIAYRHPVLDARLGITTDTPILSDDELKRLIDDFVAACALAQKAGFSWVDVKHCHGYLGHELLSGFDRPGEFGGSFENRTRFLRDIVAGIRANAPGLHIGVRVSVFDFVPFQPSATHDRVGVPSTTEAYHCAFGGDGSGTGI